MKSILKIMKTIESHEKAVLKRRDQLDDFILELEYLKEGCEVAYEYLQDARDALSRMV